MSERLDEDKFGLKAEITPDKSFEQSILKYENIKRRKYEDFQEFNSKKLSAV